MADKCLTGLQLIERPKDHPSVLTQKSCLPKKYGHTRQAKVEMSGVSPKLKCPVPQRHGWLGDGRQASLPLPQLPPPEGRGSAGVRPERPAGRCTAGRVDLSPRPSCFLAGPPGAGIGLGAKLRGLGGGPPKTSPAPSFLSFTARCSRYLPLKRIFIDPSACPITPATSPSTHPAHADSSQSGWSPSIFFDINRTLLLG